MSNFNLDRAKFSHPPSCQALSKHENKLRNLRNASKKHSVEWQRYISHFMRLRKSFTCLQTRYIDERRDIGRTRSTWRPTIIDTGRGTGSGQVVDTFNCKRLSCTSFISSENGWRAAGLWPIYFRYTHYPVILITRWQTLWVTEVMSLAIHKGPSEDSVEKRSGRKTPKRQDIYDGSWSPTKPYAEQSCTTESRIGAPAPNSLNYAQDTVPWMDISTALERRAAQLVIADMGRKQWNITSWNAGNTGSKENCWGKI